MRVLGADLAGELQRRVGAVGKEHELRAELQLHQCLDLGVGVVVLGPTDKDVGVGRHHLGHDGREVLRLSRVDLLVHGLDAGRLEANADVLRDGRGERVVELGIGGRLGTRAGRKGEDPVGEHVARLGGGGGLDKEQVMQILCEDRRSTASWLQERVPVAIGNL